jgi:hypothetical protein
MYKGLTFFYFWKEIVIAGLLKDFDAKGDEMQSTPGALYRASDCAWDSTPRDSTPLCRKNWGEEEEKYRDTNSEEDLSTLLRICDSDRDPATWPEKRSDREWDLEEGEIYVSDADSALSSPASRYGSCSAMFANGVATEFTDREDQSDRLSSGDSQQEVKLRKHSHVFFVRFIFKLGNILTSESKVFWILDILVWIRIRGSMPLTNGSGSCFFVNEL